MKYILSLCLLCFLPLLAQAEMRPPAPSHVTIQRTFDRASPPTDDIKIWRDELGGYDSTDPLKWGQNGWLCESNSDPKHGQCKTSLLFNATGETIVPLLFIEKRSGMRQVLNLRGHATHYFDNSTACAGFSGSVMQIYNSSALKCQGSSLWSSGAALTVTLPASELKKLPVGGLWEADLRLKLHQGDPYYVDLADFTAHFQFDVIDPNHIEIFFPAFRHATPLVELDLRPQGAPDQNPYAQDVTPLDMCLYDGYNANSTKYEVLLKDEGLPHAGRAAKDFSIYRTGGEADSLRDRIDYHIQLKNPETGELMPVKNNEQIIWTQINQKLIRPVRLPSLSYPVLCVPTPLLLNVDKFDITTKNAGRYTGKLTVIFTPTTPTVN